MSDAFGGQIRDMRYRGPDEYDRDLFEPDNMMREPGYNQPSPGFQMPTPGITPMPDLEIDTPSPQDNEQYFLQMRQSIESLNEAMKQIQGMKTPGGQYSGGGAQMMTPGGNYDSGAK